MSNWTGIGVAAATGTPTTQTTITHRVYKGVTLTDPTSIKLSDPTSTYGVRRTDTDAVVVSDNTSMTKISTGIYQHTFTDPAYDLIYEYYVEIVIDAVTHYSVGTIEGNATPAETTSTTGVPSSYTAASLKAFMHSEVGEIATILGWSVAGGYYDEPLIDALFLSDVEDITDVTTKAGVCKLRALARVAVWRQAVKRVSARYDFSADGGSYSRSQLQSMCADALAVAEVAAAPYLTEMDDDNTNTIQIYAERPRQDPYSYLDEEDRTL